MDLTADVKYAALHRMNGMTLGAHYRILEKLGEGATGQVFLAEHVQRKRKEAVKLLQPDLAVNPQSMSRFRREARATNRVQHRNIVSVYDFGHLPDGTSLPSDGIRRWGSGSTGFSHAKAR